MTSASSCADDGTTGDDPPNEVDVPASLIQPGDLPSEPGSIRVDHEARALNSYSPSSTCASYDEVVLTDAGWKATDSVAYHDVAGRTVTSSVLAGGSEPKAAIDAVSRRVTDCAATAAADGFEKAMEALQFDTDAVGFQSNSSDGVREGRRVYAVVDNKIVHVTVIERDVDPEQNPIDLEGLIETAAQRLSS